MEKMHELSITLYLQSEITFCSVRMESCKYVWGRDEWASGNSGNFQATSLIKDIKPKILVRLYRGCVLWSNRHGSVHCAWVNGEASLECVWRQLGGAWAGENSGKY